MHIPTSVMLSLRPTYLPAELASSCRSRSFPTLIGIFFLSPLSRADGLGAGRTVAALVGRPPASRLRPEHFRELGIFPPAVRAFPAARDVESALRRVSHAPLRAASRAYAASRILLTMRAPLAVLQQETPPSVRRPRTPHALYSEDTNCLGRRGEFGCRGFTTNRVLAPLLA